MDNFINLLIFPIGPILVVIYGIVLFNKMVFLRQNRKNAFSDIDVQLKQRLDLIPTLVETVKGYAAHEKTVFENVTAARAGVAASGNNMDDRIKAEQKLGMALASLYAVAENYPALKADQNFAQLMSELSDIENKIAAARRFFNNATSQYNTATEQFPSNILAKMFRFTPETFYEDTSMTRTQLETAPNVKF